MKKLSYIWKSDRVKLPYNIRRKTRQGISIDFFKSMDKFSKKWVSNLIPVYRGKDTPNEQEYDSMVESYREMRNELFLNKL
tara:strand:- start:94 stop:336 length:243 start_codon:yes stop_codon:yes gene_type:complete